MPILLPIQTNECHEADRRKPFVNMALTENHSCVSAGFLKTEPRRRGGRVVVQLQEALPDASTPVQGSWFESRPG